MDLVNSIDTPFYYYDMALLDRTIEEIKRHTAGTEYIVHYAVKANGNPHILKTIAQHGLGADLVSGQEIKAAIEAGFNADKLSFSGVGKTDSEIRLGLEQGIACFNVESVPELMVINDLARHMGTVAHIAIRVNPDIDAHTHRYITTGTASNKFGIGIDDLDEAIDMAAKMENIDLTGLHFHIGSQITSMQPFAMLCDTVNRLTEHYRQRGITFRVINVGGGLGIDYSMPDERPIADFKSYFDTFKRGLKVNGNQQIHFELGRAIVANCGSLISRVTFVKENRSKKFVILDAGMTDLIRPALYGAHHKIQNLTAAPEAAVETYDVVGPVCESSDVFEHDCSLPVTRRGDLMAIRSAGAYGESMASCYNMRRLPGCAFARDKQL